MSTQTDRPAVIVDLMGDPTSFAEFVRAGGGTVLDLSNLMGADTTFDPLRFGRD